MILQVIVDITFNLVDHFLGSEVQILGLIMVYMCWALSDSHLIYLNVSGSFLISDLKHIMILCAVLYTSLLELFDRVLLS